MIARAWARYEAAVSKLTLRERVLVLGAGLAVVVGLTYLLAVEPFLAARVRRAAEGSAWQTELTTLRAQVTQAAAARTSPAGQGPMQRVQALRDRLNALTREIDAAGADDVQVGLLRPAVHRLLSRHDQLQLVALDTSFERVAGLEPLSTGDATKAAPAAAAVTPVAPAEVVRALQRYTVKVTLDGAYLDLLAYLEALERELPDVRWGDMKLSVPDNGVVRLTLNLYMWRRPPA